MIEILSLPRRPNTNMAEIAKKFRLNPGLPINSLPGWEQIPLNSKLPMLKCRGNQVIFSKNKIGLSKKEKRQVQHEFDTSTQGGLPEYNPLQDLNLRRFYANERNLKRLRENGEITAENDVICSLRDFNEYRQQLYKSHWQFASQEIARLDAEKRDRMLISNAEHITSLEHGSQAVMRHNSHAAVQARKAQLDEEKAEHFKKNYEKVQDKFIYANMLKSIKFSSYNQRKYLNDLKIQKHCNLQLDVQRRKLIKSKKEARFKKERFRKNMRRLNLPSESKEFKQLNSWNKRLNARIEKQKKINALFEELEKKKQIFIKNHKSQYQERWQKIQGDIKLRAEKNRKFGREVPKVAAKASRQTFCTAFDGSFEKLLEEEICQALQIAGDIEANMKISFDADDPIYKAAKFITDYILKRFQKDLSTDKVAYDCVYHRVQNYFDEAKKYMIFRSTQIITAARESTKKEEMWKSNTITKKPFNGCLSLNREYNSRVSFNRISSTIGISSYTLHPLMEIKNLTDRKPTPAGSLDSIVIASDDDLSKKAQTSTLCQNELIFIEHYVAKFKRNLIVGIGRRVFAAIECHLNGKIMEVRQELMEIDRKFLIKQVTKSILSYAINPFNFEAILKLCISALSSDIIWCLQKQLLKPARDTRYTVKPHVNCKNRSGNPLLMCSHCQGDCCMPPC